MPIYEFECKKCKKEQEVIMSFGDYDILSNPDDCGLVDVCKSCGTKLYIKDQIINFTGGINMNSSAVGVANRKYSNRVGGPEPIIDGKHKAGAKPKW